MIIGPNEVSNDLERCMLDSNRLAFDRMDLGRAGSFNIVYRNMHDGVDRIVGKTILVLLWHRCALQSAH